MTITQKGSFQVSVLEGETLSEKDREALLKFANEDEDLEEELTALMDEADKIARPTALFAVCPVEENATVNGVCIPSELAVEKLTGRSRCFPDIATCGRELEVWSEQYKGDYLAEFWADEIKKKFLFHVTQATLKHIREAYRTAGHLAAINPGSLEKWPVSGQQELFAILSGREYVKETIGVIYTDSFLMLPSKTVSGIAFESEVFYENCQHCPLERCPNRRAKRV